MDKQQYKGRHQELPAVYTNAKWNNLVTYRGLAPFTNDTLTHIKKLLQNYAWVDWPATENWAANVDSSNWGLGIWNDGTQEFKGGFAGNWGDRGGEKDFPTAYIAPIQQEILDYNITHNYQFTMILGSVNEIRNYVYSHRNKKQLPSYKFINNRQSWIYENAIDAGWPIKNKLSIHLSKGAAMISPQLLWNAADASYVTFSATYNSKVEKTRIFWRPFGGNFEDKNSVVFTIIPDGQLHQYKIPLSVATNYKGALTGLKILLDADNNADGNNVVDVYAISLQ